MKNIKLLTLCFFAAFFAISAAGALLAQEEEYISVSTAVKPAVVAEAKVPESGAAVQDVKVVEIENRIKVIVTTSVKTRFKTTELSSPTRILLQLENCSAKANTVKAGKGAVDKVRVAPHDGAAWIVVDMNSPQKWQVNDEGNRITIDIDKGAGAAPGKIQVQAEHRAATMMYRVVDVAAAEQDKKVRLIITTDGPAKYRLKKDTRNKSITLSIMDAVSTVPDAKQEVNKGAVNAIFIKENKQSKVVDVNIALNSNSPYTVNRDSNQIIVDIDKPEQSGKTRERKLDLRQKISLNVQNASLTGVLKLLSSQTGFEFATSPSVATAGTVSISEDNQPLVLLLRDVLSPAKLTYEVSGSIIKVGSMEDLKAARAMLPKVTKFYYPKNFKAPDFKTMLDAALTKNTLIDIVTSVDPTTGKNRILIYGSQPDVDSVMEMISSMDVSRSGESEFSNGLVTRVFKLKNIRLKQNDANEIAEGGMLDKTLQGLISKDGKCTYDWRTSSVIVTDDAESVKRIAEVMKQLDVRVKQVMIEAKLYEVDITKVNSLGVNWSAVSQNNEPLIRGDVNPSGALVGSGTVGQTGTGTLTIGTLQSGFNITAYLSALENNSQATLLSSPKISVEDNKAAMINTTRTTYYTTQTVVTNAAGPPVIATTFNPLQLPIALQVICRVVNKDEVDMNVNINVTKILTANTVANGPPDTSSQQATSFIKAQDNETIVIGGLISERLGDIVNKVPILGDIPLLGELFKSTTKTVDKVELVVFLTPSILED
jgi:type IV pilus assembly protein PilQ